MSLLQTYLTCKDGGVLRRRFYLLRSRYESWDMLGHEGYTRPSLHIWANEGRICRLHFEDSSLRCFNVIGLQMRTLKRAAPELGHSYCLTLPLSLVRTQAILSSQLPASVFCFFIPQYRFLLGYLFYILCIFYYSLLLNKLLAFCLSSSACESAFWSFTPHCTEFAHLAGSSHLTSIVSLTTSSRVASFTLTTDLAFLMNLFPLFASLFWSLYAGKNRQLKLMEQQKEVWIWDGNC